LEIWLSLFSNHWNSPLSPRREARRIFSTPTGDSMNSVTQLKTVKKIATGLIKGEISKTGGLLQRMRRSASTLVLALLGIPLFLLSMIFFPACASPGGDAKSKKHSEPYVEVWSNKPPASGAGEHAAPAK
jgi:hypothetical protein